MAESYRDRGFTGHPAGAKSIGAPNRPGLKHLMKQHLQSVDGAWKRYVGLREEFACGDSQLTAGRLNYLAYKQVCEEYGLEMVKEVGIAAKRQHGKLIEQGFENGNGEIVGVLGLPALKEVTPVSVSAEALGKVVDGLGGVEGSGWVDGGDIAKAIDWVWGCVGSGVIDEKAAPNLGAVFLARMVMRSREDQEWFLREWVMPRVKGQVAGYDERRRRDDGRDLMDRLERLEKMLGDDDLVPVKA